MKNERRNLVVWKTLHFLAGWFLRLKFKYKHDRVRQDRGFLVVSNHVTNWDPLLLALSFPKNNIHFVASEHLFRMGFVSKLINFLVAPIARRKGSSGLDTAMASARIIRNGGAVCVFGEGECTWDGANIGIVPSTGGLARVCGAPLITYKLEGGYLSLPRWGNGKVRRGGMRGHIVNIYEPEQLRRMKPDEITELINRDIFEDAWERQRREMVRYKGTKRAEGIEGALFICPECRRAGTLKGVNNTVKCECGFETTINEYGFFEPAKPFETIQDWDKWQLDALANGAFEHGDLLFHDDGVSLSEVNNDHSVVPIAEGRLSLKDDTFTIGSESFAFKAISDLAVVRTNRIIFTCGDKYYEMRVKGHECLRKYWLAWKFSVSAASVSA